MAASIKPIKKSSKNLSLFNELPVKKESNEIQILQQLEE